MIPFFLVVCTCCRDPLDAEINGHRLIMSDGCDRVPIFDAEMRPVIRVAGPERNLRVTLSTGGQPRQLAVRAVREHGATFLHVLPSTIAPGEAELTVSASTGERASFEIRFSQPPEALPEIRRIVEAREAREFDEAMTFADAAVQSEDPLVRVFAAIERGRIAHRRGDSQEAVRLWREGSDIARRAGAITEIGARLNAAAHVATNAGSFALAEDLLALATEAADESEDPYNRLTLLSERAWLASQLGEQRTALALYRETARLTEHIGLERARYDSGLSLGIYLTGLGRFEEALRAFSSSAAHSGLDPSERARIDVNIAWAEILGMQSGALALDLDHPRRRLERAISALRALPDEGWRLANALCTLARAELLANDLSRADQLVREAARDHPPIMTERVHDCSFVEIEIRLARGEVIEAERLLSRLEPRIEEGLLFDLAASPASLKARIARALGREDAVARGLEAFDSVVAMTRQIPIQSDRAGFVAARTAVVGELIELMIERGDLEGAFSIADTARALVFSDLDAEVRLARLDPGAKKEWASRLERYRSLRNELPKLKAECDRLPSSRTAACLEALQQRRRGVSAALDHAFELLDRKAPTSAIERVSADQVIAALGEHAALLIVHDDKERMRSFWLDRAGIRHQRGAPPLEEWLEDSIDRLYVIGSWDPIAADTSTSALAARVAVVMLPSARFLLEATPSPTGLPVIAGDPNGDLPGARREAKGIDRDGLLLLGASASRSAVLGALDGARFFHFGGHARVIGASVWDAELVAADGAITLEDLLLGRPHVGVAVLSACSSGREAASGELGLPHAFLLGGARAVLATIRPLDDAVDGSFVTRFYRARGPERPIEAFREAVAASVAAGDDAWRAFRLFGR